MTITPDEARDQLDGATPGPWTLGASPFEVWSVVPTDLGPDHGSMLGTFATEEDAYLACTAPDLAQTIAGMTEEWGVERDLPWSAYIDGTVARGITWIGDEARARKACAISPRGGNPRLVRRLVGPVEVVEEA